MLCDVPFFHVDFYRVIKLCGLLVGLWGVYVVALGKFKSGITAERPHYNVVDFERDFGQNTKPIPIAELAKERGWNDSGHFITSEGAKILEREYEHKRWIALGFLALALISASAIVLTGQRIWDSWILGVAVVIFGPLAIAWGMRRLKTEA